MARVRRAYLALTFLLGPFPLLGACSGDNASGTHGPVFDGGVDAPRTDAGGDGSNPSQGDAALFDVSRSSDGGADSEGAGVPADGSIPDAMLDAPTCGSTTALLGASSTAAFGAISNGGPWTSAPIAGSAASPPAILGYNGGFVGALRAATTNALLSVTYAGSWSAATPIGAALTLDAPALAFVGATVHVAYLGTDHLFYHGTYTTSNGWDAANDKVMSGVAQSFGPSGPAAAASGASFVIAQDGSNNALYDQPWTGTWQSAIQIPGAKVGTVPPTMIAVSGGNADLLLVYVDQGDFKLYFSLHGPSGWSAPALVNAAAYTSVPVSLAALSGGGAALVFEGSDLNAYTSLYDPAAATPWTAPAPLVAAKVTLTSPPSIASGVCGDEAVAAICTASGAAVVHLRNGSWSSPEMLAGTAGMTFASIATSL